jgi:dTDP-glucose 4,6-dehydratase
MQVVPRNMGESVLITGGAGFIGSALVKMVLANRDAMSIVVVDKLTYAGNLANLESVWKDDRFHFYRADIADRGAMARVFKKGRFDIVINLAAETHVDRSIVDARPFVYTNVLGTQVLVDLCVNNGVKNYVQVSTDEVYGMLSADGRPFVETDLVKPRNPYAASKAAADLIVMASHETHGLPALLTRCCNVYGPYQYPEKLIPVIITNALEDKPVPIYGDGQNIRDWIHVDDHCRGILAAIEKGAPGEIYNFGGHSEVANIDVARMALNFLKKPESLIRHVADRKGHDFRYALSFEKARSMLGWEPLTPFPEGLEATVKWYASNPSWINELKAGHHAKQYQRYLKQKRG